MKNLHRLFALTVATIMLISTLAACTDTPSENTEGASTEIETLDPNFISLITRGDDNRYIVICDDDAPANVKNAADGIVSQINSIYKVDISSYREDVAWGCPNSSDHEILIGNTTREETAEAKKLLTGEKNEYAIKLFENGKIAIVASNYDTLVSAVNYFLITFITESEYTDMLRLPKAYEYHCVVVKEDNLKLWKLSAPAYEYGALSARTYGIGRNGTFSASGSTGKMQLATDTTAEEFSTYIDKLITEGYTVVANTEVNENLYYQLSKGNKLYYMYYTNFAKEARFIEDHSSLAETEFEYVYTPKEGETAAIYQYGLMQNPTGRGGPITDTKRYENNGAFLIIRLSDNSLILIDGGRPDQATEKSTEALMDFLYEITGVDKESDEKIRVACLFFSHGDGDHLSYTYNLFTDPKYSERIALERILHNLPGDHAGSVDARFAPMGTAIYETYPNVKYAKAHTGQSIQLADATIDILYTHEDMVDAVSATAKVKDNNLLSTMFKLTVNGVTFLAMGDFGVGSGEEKINRDRHDLCEERFLNTYKDAEGNYPFLKCDILQVAHHAINDYNGRIHAIIEADYAFFSQQDVKYEDMAYPCYTNIVDQLREAGMEDKHMYFQGRQTNWLTIAQDGTITHGHKKIEGVDEGYYYYKTSNGQTIYEDAEGKATTDSTTGIRITDTTGDATIEGFDNIEAVYIMGYWELLEPYEPFWPDNNT